MSLVPRCSFGPDHSRDALAAPPRKGKRAGSGYGAGEDPAEMCQLLTTSYGVYGRETFV